MSILINKNTRVITQGITGKTGQFHTLGCQAYANGKAAFVAGVNPKKAGEKFSDMKITYDREAGALVSMANTTFDMYTTPAGSTIFRSECMTTFSVFCCAWAGTAANVAVSTAAASRLLFAKDGSLMLRSSRVGLNFELARSVPVP